jgi:hypothetical protein
VRRGRLRNPNKFFQNKALQVEPSFRQGKLTREAFLHRDFNICGKRAWSQRNGWEALAALDEP